jgi:peptidoglycan hydrolase CwlO-like protein
MIFAQKVIRPFKKFYDHIRPEDFAYLFQGESVSTVAFILSFCRKKTFIKKVLREWNSDEITESISKYLSTCTEIYFDADLTRQIEIYCDKLIELYKDSDAVKGFRKNIPGIAPIRKEQRYFDNIKEDFKDMTNKIKSIDSHIVEYLKSLEKREKNNSSQSGLKIGNND